MTRFAFLALGVLASGSIAMPAHAGTLRDLCPTRPGLGTPPCIVDRGHVLAESGLADWTREKDAATRTDTLLYGDLLLRFGIDARSEVQIGWTPYGTVRTRDSAARMVDRSGGTGDVMLAFKHSLAAPDGSGLSLAVQPFATLPTGGEAIGAGDWSAGLIAPFSMDIGRGMSFQLSPEIDAAVDADGKGRHVAYGSVAGLGIDLSQAVNAAIELSAFHDDDPDGHVTEWLAATSLAWTVSDRLQLDAGGAFGLNSDSPDARLYVGVARRF